MKKIGLILWVFVFSGISTFAIEGLNLSLQGTDVVLRWPGGTNNIFTVQYRATLDPSDPWQTLTNALSSATGTNLTTFVHSNVVCYPTNSGSGSGGGSFPALQSFSSESSESSSFPPMPPLPPDPRDPSTWSSSNSENSFSSTSNFDVESAGDGGDGGGESVCSGFYRVWHVPNFPSSITNYSFDGPIFIPVDFKDYREHVASVEVLIDGQPTTDAEFMPYVTSGQTNWGMGIYFDRFNNGTHQIQLITTLHLNDAVGDDSIYVVLSNATKSITVANLVTFADWNDLMQGDTYTFKAKISNPDTDWTIDIFDAGGQYVNSGSGHTTNGLVEWTWDLYDYLGYNRDDFDNDPFFYSQITFDDGSSLTSGGAGAAASGGVTVPMPPPMKGYPNEGEWIIAFQDRWFADTTYYASDLQAKYEEAISLIFGGVQLLDEHAYWWPLRFGTNVYTKAEREYGWTNLMAAFSDPYIKNFYYHGHGGGKSFGCDMHTYKPNGEITGGGNASKNTKSQIFSWQIAGKTKLNRLRFVFLDGCSTATGDLPNAFNISKQTNNLAFYENHPKHPRPSVFVGWNETVGGDPSWGSAYDRIEFQAAWMGEWANNFNRPGIKTAITQANVFTTWIHPDKLNATLRVFGYADMRAMDYNHKGDWRWP